ncbi:signal peptide peptidase SppA [Parasegetibacter sp. NRK P23]|uniref:signal peptide peptidase SppA n=1 Tax=Parasegetibacter sp. NRK P23 TaxID=2942999 RepID=UPI002044901E|nr:signal peptide peptidase SppA [Parasegetibacter sp. NRK P23]MCM5528756.1 signal peptide peptidase SppA [Parasegetibacter sp. NRK P23]
MRSFFKFFFASLLALVVFSLIGFFIMMMVVAGLTSKEPEAVAAKSVLVLDLSLPYMEQELQDPIAELSGESDRLVPGLYDVVRLIDKAAKDSSIKALYIKAGNNPNGFAASEEIRNAVIRFRSKRKPVIAYAEYISQKAYFVANAANKVYVHPKGGMEWMGLSAQIPFIKGTLDKLEIEPQIFYAGKFKSATEPLREYKMTDANKLQTLEMLEDMYRRMLVTTAEARQVDTATLRALTLNAAVKTAQDAVSQKLIDGLKYDDEVKAELRTHLKLAKDAAISFVSMGSYSKAVNYKRTGSMSNRIAVIYAEGDILSGKGAEGQIGSDTYRNLIHKARTDKAVKAIVLRINSGGGSSIASETIWRELSLARKDKPVVVSFGDVAASGGYYMACAGDSIFAQPNTITGSIGVFGMIFNLKQFMDQKLGVTFDGVKTAPLADMGNAFRPLNETEKAWIQQEIDQIYLDFKTRVSDARKLSMEYVDSIAQGRVWTGERALKLGLIDKLGGLEDAIACAARMAKVSDYRVREFPEPQSFLDKIFNTGKEAVRTNALKEELGAEGFALYQRARFIRQHLNQAQTRMPFDILVHPGRFSVEQ